MNRSNINIESEFISLEVQLKSYLYRLSCNKEDMEDLFQDTYIRVKEKIETFKSQSSFKTWVFAIATNLAKDNKRVRNRWQLDAQDKCKDAAMTNPQYLERMMFSFQNQTEKRFDIAEHMNYCFSCIVKNLMLEEQIALILKEIYHFKRNEIADILDKTEGVIKHLLYNGRKELQSKYNQRCALINKRGMCYQCAELNDTLQGHADSTDKIALLGLSNDKSEEANLDIRFSIINKINPLNGNGADLEDTILQILRETINDN